MRPLWGVYDVVRQETDCWALEGWDLFRPFRTGLPAGCAACVPASMTWCWTAHVTTPMQSAVSPFRVSVVISHCLHSIKAEQCRL